MDVSRLRDCLRSRPEGAAAFLSPESASGCRFERRSSRVRPSSGGYCPSVTRFLGYWRVAKLIWVVSRGLWRQEQAAFRAGAPYDSRRTIVCSVPSRPLRPDAKQAVTRCKGDDGEREAVPPEYPICPVVWVGHDPHLVGSCRWRSSESSCRRSRLGW